MYYSYEYQHIAFICTAIAKQFVILTPVQRALQIPSLRFGRGDNTNRFVCLQVP